VLERLKASGMRAPRVAVADIFLLQAFQTSVAHVATPADMYQQVQDVTPWQRFERENVLTER